MEVPGTCFFARPLLQGDKYHDQIHHQALDAPTTSTERSRRAKVIHAEGEFQASQKLADAARVLAGQPQALQLRYLQTLTDISSEGNSSTIVFPLPIDLIGPVLEQFSDRKPGP